ncbi:hypothetical protein ACFLZW_05485 [Chloroflexota bacterium]
MSEVISFRLDKDNLREAKALLVLQEWRVKGYSLRQIMTDALLKLDEVHNNLLTTQYVELQDMLAQVTEILTQIGNTESDHGTQRNRGLESTKLSETFVFSVKKSAKQGMKCN